MLEVVPDVLFPPQPVKLSEPPGRAPEDDAVGKIGEVGVGVAVHLFIELHLSDGLVLPPG